MATRTISNAGGNWNSVGTWVEGAVPTSSDDVVATATSGNVTVNSPGGFCRSLDLTNYTGTIANSITALGVGGTTPGPSNVAVKIPATATFTTLGIALISTSATQQTVDIKTANIPSISVNGTGSSYILVSNLIFSGSLVFARGTFNTGGFSLGCTAFSASGANAITVNLNSSTITLTNWNTATATNFTLNAGTSNIVLNGSGGTFTPGARTFYKVTVNNDNITLNGGCTIDQLILNNAGGATGTKFTASTTRTILTSITTNGSAGNLNKILSTSPGVPATFSVASGTISIDYVSLQDSTATGGASFYAGSYSTNVSGNTGWTFTGPPGGGSSLTTKRGCGPTVGATISHWVC